MKLVFWPKDSIYKIFSSIQKLPDGKKVTLFIKKWNVFYDNIWWWKQLIQILKNKQIDFTFICEKSTEKYFKTLGVDCQLRKSFKKVVLNFLKKLFFQNYFYQKTLLKSKSWFWYILVLLEIVLVIFIFKRFYDFISHHAVIYIKPAYNVETLVYNFLVYTWKINNTSKKISIPFYKRIINVNQTLTLNVTNLKYLTSPAHWQVKIFNYTDKDISFKAGTKFVTDDWLVFRSKYWFRLPPAKNWKPGVAYTTLIAMDRDLDWNIIWKRWNIGPEKKLYILKYWPSIDLHKIYAVPVSRFEWGQTIWKWMVTDKDIATLKEKLKQAFKANLVNYILQDIWKDKQKIFLRFPELIHYKIRDFLFDAKPWDVRAVINWTLEWQIVYYYILWKDVKKWFIKYLEDRSLDTQRIVDIDRNSLVLLDLYKISKNVFFIPIQIDVVKWYNFDIDKNWLIDKIKTEILWKNKNEAKKIILSYPQIDAAVIKIYPIWYNTLPSLKSAIVIKQIKN